MIGVEELKERIRAEVAGAKNRVHSMQAEAAAEFEQAQARYRAFLEISGQIREAIRPRMQAFAEALPGAPPTVTRRDFGPGGRGFHGVVVAFSLPHSEQCPATLDLRFSLEAGPSIESVVLSYDLDIIPVFMEYERHDRVALPLEPSSVERAVEWFDAKVVQFTQTYINMLFNPHYQRGSEVPDVVLGMSFPRVFAKDRCEYQGTTYYFFTEESRQAFEADPARYLGTTAAKPGR